MKIYKTLVTKLGESIENNSLPFFTSYKEENTSLRQYVIVSNNGVIEYNGHIQRNAINGTYGCFMIPIIKGAKYEINMPAYTLFLSKTGFKEAFDNSQYLDDYVNTEERDKYVMTGANNVVCNFDEDVASTHIVITANYANSENGVVQCLIPDKVVE